MLKKKRGFATVFWLNICICFYDYLGINSLKLIITLTLYNKLINKGFFNNFVV